MKKLNSLVFLTTAAALCLTDSVYAQNTYWLPESGYWADAENWSGGLPGTSNETYFGLYPDSFDGNKTAIINAGQSFNIGLLQIGYGQAATFTMEAGSSLSLQGTGVATIGMLRGTNAGSSSLRIVANDAETPSTFNAVNIRIGGHASGSDNSTLEFSGAGLRANVTGDLRIGQFKNGNNVTINNGAQFSGLTGKVGWAVNRNSTDAGNNNSLLVDGAATRATFSGTAIVMNVGSTASGDEQAISGNRIDVTNGATLRIEGRTTGAVRTVVGIDAYSQGNSINVNGANSRLELGGNMTLEIGSADSNNSANHVTVGNGGKIKNEGTLKLVSNGSDANYLRIAAGGSYAGSGDISNTGGTIYLEDGGSLTGETIDGSAALQTTINLLSNSGGSASYLYAEGNGLGDTVNINAQSGSVISIGQPASTSASTLQLNSSIMMDADSTLQFIIFSGSDISSINFGQTGSLSGATTLAISFVSHTASSGDQWTLFSGNIAGIDSDFLLSTASLPDLEPGLLWDISRLNAEGGWVLAVVPEPKSSAALTLVAALGVGYLIRRRTAPKPAK